MFWIIFIHWLCYEAFSHSKNSMKEIQNLGRSKKTYLIHNVSELPSSKEQAEFEVLETWVHVLQKGK